MLRHSITERHKSYLSILKFADLKQKLIDEYDSKLKSERSTHANEIKTFRKAFDEKVSSYEAKIMELEVDSLICSFGWSLTKTFWFQKNIDKLTQLAERCKENEEKLKSFDQLKQRYEKELKNHEVIIKL